MEQLFLAVAWGITIWQLKLMVKQKGGGIKATLIFAKGSKFDG
jgi:hypothetical protein